jgi:predicted Zn-dependent protease
MTAPINVVLTHPSLPGGRANGSLTADKRAVTIVAGDTKVAFPIKGIDIAWGGANNALLFLRHPSEPEWSAFTRDREIITVLRPLADDALLKGIAKLGRRRLSGVTSLATFFGIICLLIAALMALHNPLTLLVAQLLPISIERKIGEAVYLGVRSDTRILDDAALTAEFTELLLPITQAAQESGYTFEFHIAKDSSLNAFALPGGIIVVNSGAIMHADRLDLLLGVLAHEASHVTRQHMTRQVVTVFGLYMVVDFVMGNVFGSVAAISQGASYLLQQGFSRESEQEADLYGLQYLERARVNPQGMVDFFKLVQKEQKESSLAPIEGALSFLSTHPDTESRIEYLTERIKSMPPIEYRELPEEKFRQFKTKLQPLL